MLYQLSYEATHWERGQFIAMIILHFHLQPQFIYGLFHINFTSFHYSRENMNSINWPRSIVCLFCNIPTLIKLQYDELVTFHNISYLQYRPNAPNACSFLVNSHRKGAGLLFLTSVLINQNYVAVFVILITFKSSTERDIFVSLEYIVSVTLRNIFKVANYFYLHEILISFSFRVTKKNLLSRTYFCWTCLPCKLQAFTLITFILTVSINHFFVELNKTNCFHRLKISHWWTNRVVWRCLYFENIYFFFTITIKSSSEFSKLVGFQVGCRKKKITCEFDCAGNCAGLLTNQCSAKS